jgi:hypothetical protein
MMLKVNPNFNYTGWELAPDCLMAVQDIICDHYSHFDRSGENNFHILEFGSGKSTQFFADFLNTNKEEGFLSSYSNILSFDADPKFAHPDAKIVPLREYPKEIFGENFHFYDIRRIDDYRSSRENFDLVIVDGHDGPGRSMAFSMMYRNVYHCGTIVVIDDYDHYPFERDFLMVYPNSKLLERRWENNNRWLIYEIK